MLKIRFFFTIQIGDILQIKRPDVKGDMSNSRTLRETKEDNYIEIALLK